MAESVQAVGECVHHWVIAPPAGETSVGLCKFCGARKEFPNSGSVTLFPRKAQA